MSKIRFFKCMTCGNIVGVIHNTGIPMMCCGEEMTELVPGTVDASREKHLPVVTFEGDILKVSVGEAEHPMAEEHSIQWIYVQTERGGQRKCLLPGEKPEARFALCDEKPLAVYEYCNLHGLWKTDIK